MNQSEVGHMFPIKENWLTNDCEKSIKFCKSGSSRYLAIVVLINESNFVSNQPL